jgi:thymidylate kinase
VAANKKKRNHKRGVHIAFIGVDGAGKSTTVEKVQAMLAQAGKIKFHSVYMGPWGQIRSPLFKKVYEYKLFPPREDWGALIRQKLSGQPVSHSLPRMALKWFSGTLKGWAYYLGVYQEMWFRFLTEVRPNLQNGRVVLSDRYIYDLRYIYKTRPISSFRIWRWFVSRFFPKPDRVVFIWNTAEDIISRKPQLGAAEINLFQDTYRKVLADKPTMEMRSDRPPEVIAGDIVRMIMNIYLGAEEKGAS